MSDVCCVQLSDFQRKKVQDIELELLCDFDKVCRANKINYYLAYGSLLGAVRHKGFIPWDDDIDVCMTRSDFKRLCQIADSEFDESCFFQTHETDPEYMLFYGRLRKKRTIFKEIYFEEYNIESGVYIDIFPVDNYKTKSIRYSLYRIGFRLCRILLNSKYYKLEARTGKKKLFASLIRYITPKLSCEKIYTWQKKIARKCDLHDGDTYINLTSPYGGIDVFKKDMYEPSYVDFENHQFMTFNNVDLFLKTIYGNYMTLPPVSERRTEHILTALDFGGLNSE